MVFGADEGHDGAIEDDDDLRGGVNLCAVGAGLGGGDGQRGRPGEDDFHRVAQGEAIGGRGRAIQAQGVARGGRWGRSGGEDYLRALDVDLTRQVGAEGDIGGGAWIKLLVKGERDRRAPPCGVVRRVGGKQYRRQGRVGLGWGRALEGRGGLGADEAPKATHDQGGDKGKDDRQWGASPTGEALHGTSLLSA